MQNKLGVYILHVNAGFNVKGVVLCGQSAQWNTSSK
jgi:hypothetical protein